MSLPRIFLINVGVNASHGSLRSPIFEDGSFIFVPIPEEGGNSTLTYRELFQGKLDFIPSRFRD